MNFVGVTITDLNEKYREMTIRSIKSFLKFHDTKLFVHIVGDKELGLADERIEIVRLPKTEYAVDNMPQPYQSARDIFIEKLLCLTRYKNFIFFENDVFFLRSMDTIWDRAKPGVTGANIVVEKVGYSTAVNSGLLLVKNYSFNYTLKDILNYFSNNRIIHPCDQFVTNYAHRDINYCSSITNILVYEYGSSKDISILNCTHSVHYVGKQKVFMPHDDSTIFLRKLKEKIIAITR